MPVLQCDVLEETAPGSFGVHALGPTERSYVATVLPPLPEAEHALGQDAMTLVNSGTEKQPEEKIFWGIVSCGHPGRRPGGRPGGYPGGRPGPKTFPPSLGLQSNKVFSGRFFVPCKWQPTVPFMILLARHNRPLHRKPRAP